jgi:hypothetical protein
MRAQCLLGYAKGLHHDRTLFGWQPGFDDEAAAVVPEVAQRSCRMASGISLELLDALGAAVVPYDRFDVARSAVARDGQ